MAHFPVTHHQNLTPAVKSVLSSTFIPVMIKPGKRRKSSIQSFEQRQRPRGESCLSKELINEVVQTSEILQQQEEQESFADDPWNSLYDSPQLHSQLLLDSLLEEDNYSSLDSNSYDSNLSRDSSGSFSTCSSSSNSINESFLFSSFPIPSKSERVDLNSHPLSESFTLSNSDSDSETETECEGEDLEEDIISITTKKNDKKSKFVSNLTKSLKTLKSIAANISTAQQSLINLSIDISPRLTDDKVPPPGLMHVPSQPLTTSSSSLNSNSNKSKNNDINNFKFVPLKTYSIREVLQNNNPLISSNIEITIKPREARLNSNFLRVYATETLMKKYNIPWTVQIKSKDDNNNLIIKTKDLKSKAWDMIMLPPRSDSIMNPLINICDYVYVGDSNENSNNTVITNKNKSSLSLLNSSSNNSSSSSSLSRRFMTAWSGYDYNIQQEQDIININDNNNYNNSMKTLSPETIEFMKKNFNKRNNCNSNNNNGEFNKCLNFTVKGWCNKRWIPINAY